MKWLAFGALANLTPKPLKGLGLLCAKLQSLDSYSVGVHHSSRSYVSQGRLHTSGEAKPVGQTGP